MRHGLIPTHPDYEVHSSIAKFFDGLKWHSGGPIPEIALFNETNYKLVRKVELENAISIADASIMRHWVKRKEQMARTKIDLANLDKKVVNKVRTSIAMKVIKRCEKLNISKDNIGGLLLLYLHLCEKVALV